MPPGICFCDSTVVEIAAFVAPVWQTRRRGAEHVQERQPPTFSPHELLDTAIGTPASGTAPLQGLEP
jgi:hypothetical protein